MTWVDCSCHRYLLTQWVLVVSLVILTCWYLWNSFRDIKWSKQALCVSLEWRHFPRVPHSQPTSGAFPFIFKDRNSWLSVFILQLIIHHLCCFGCDLAACKFFSWSWIWRLDYEMTVYDSLLVFPVWSSFSVLDITSNLVCSLSFFLNILICPFSSSEPPIKHCRSDGASQGSTALFTSIHSASHCSIAV